MFLILYLRTYLIYHVPNLFTYVHYYKSKIAQSIENHTFTPNVAQIATQTYHIKQ